jgi:hypothetical protein
MLCAQLRESGARVQRALFWEDVAVLTRFREFSSHTLFGGGRGIGSPDSPVNRRDKNVRSWYMTLLRFCLYSLDAISLAVRIGKIRTRDADVIVCDRYAYDEIANLSLNNPISRAYARLLLKLAPQPDLACLLDADPAQARKRKPEYPLEFVELNRASYLRLSELANMTVIAPGPVQEVSGRIMQELQRNLSGNSSGAASFDTAPKFLFYQ